MSGIVVERLGKRFGEHVAVEELSFEVRPGEVFGLLGPNGAGKTTTVRMLTGLLSPTSGVATVCGIRASVDSEELRRKVGLLTEQPGLYDRLTAKENLLFFLKLHQRDVAQGWMRARCYLERFGLAGREDDPCGTYSKGMRQKLALVRTLLHEPEVVFFDEPTSGLDPEGARTVRQAIAELAGEGRTIVLCSHNLAEIEQLCTRVGVVKNRLLAVESVPHLRAGDFVLAVRVEGEAARFEKALPFPSAASGGVLRVRLDGEHQVPDVLSALIGAGARVRSASHEARPLEEVYLELVRQEGRA